MKQLLLVGNPTAQSGKNAARIERAQALFAQHGVAAELFSTLPAGATIDALAERLRLDRDEVVVSMGGDGTFREVAAAIVEASARVTLGMLPTGTANDQGKSFGLGATEAALERNVAVVVAGKCCGLDAGRLVLCDAAGSAERADYFFDSAGFGLSARVLAVRNKDRETVAKLGPLKELYRDQLVYAGALLRTFLEAQVVDDKFSAVVEADGTSHTFHGLTDLIFKGTRLYGGAWVFDKTSRPDDGQFECVVFRGKREWTSKAIVDLEGNPVTEELLNEVGVEHSKPIRAAHFDVTLAQEGEVPIAAQIDGEEHPCSHQFRVEVLTRAITLIVPEAFADVSHPTP
ncbi:MAG: diacylglycerol kinase family protein [Polyangiaceae bacterium]